MRALILHGDDRSLYLKEIFCINGHFVDYISDISSIKLENYYDIAVLPMPLLDVGPYIEILNNAIVGKFIYASNDKDIINILSEYNSINIFDDEDLVFYNARLTAEAALAIAIGNGKRSIYSSKCLVCGFGRIGILLINMLKAMGACVTVATGSTNNSKVLSAMDIKYILYDRLENDIEYYDFIFNTVPCNIFKNDTLVDYKGMYYELASKPYGFNSDAIGFNTQRLLCSKLPGKYFPHSASLGIYETIIKYT